METLAGSIVGGTLCCRPIMSCYTMMLAIALLTAQKDIQVGKDLIYTLWEDNTRGMFFFFATYTYNFFLLIHNSYMITNIVIFSSDIVIEDK